MFKSIVQGTSGVFNVNGASGKANETWVLSFPLLSWTMDISRKNMQGFHVYSNLFKFEHQIISHLSMFYLRPLSVEGLQHLLRGCVSTKFGRWNFEFECPCAYYELGHTLYCLIPTTDLIFTILFACLFGLCLCLWILFCLSRSLCISICLCILLNICLCIFLYILYLI